MTSSTYPRQPKDGERFLGALAIYHKPDGTITTDMLLKLGDKEHFFGALVAILEAAASGDLEHVSGNLI